MSAYSASPPVTHRNTPPSTRRPRPPQFARPLREPRACHACRRSQDRCRGTEKPTRGRIRPQLFAITIRVSALTVPVLTKVWFDGLDVQAAVKFVTAKL